MIATGFDCSKARPPVAAKTDLPSTWNCTGSGNLLREAQRLGQIVDDVAGRFETDREPHKIFAYTGLLQCGRIHLRMCRAGGMNDESLCVAHIGKVGSKAEGLDESAPGLSSALDAKGDDRARTFGEEALSQSIIRMLRQARIRNPCDSWIGFQRRRHGHGVAYVTLHA